MKKMRNVILAVFTATIIWSLAPVIALYISPDARYPKNEEIAKRLKANNGDFFSFIVFGDTHAGLVFNDTSMLKMIGRINRDDRFRKRPFDFAIALGDVTFRGSAWDYRIYDRSRSRIKYPVLSAVGNHDDDAGGALFEKDVGEKEYSFADRNSFFIVLDNSINDVSDAQFGWLEAELKTSAPYAHRFIILHKPPFSPYMQSWYRPGLSAWPRRFMKLCEENKVDIVFSGHEHMFKEKVFNGVRYLVSGGGGMLSYIPTPDGGYLHYLVVRVTGPYVDYEVRRYFPPLWAYMAYYFWKDLFFGLRDVLT